jgi:class 3 adenylate cyclase
VHFITEVAAHIPETGSWYFGIDTGECAFVWSALSGYAAFGPPVVRARLLSGLAPRYKGRFLISAAVNDSLRNVLVQKLDSLKDKATGEKEVFYELLIPHTVRETAL